MTPENFAYWLQGYAELADEPPTAAQWKSIQEHLALVLTKVTPAKTVALPVIPMPHPAGLHRPIIPQPEPERRGRFWDFTC